MLGIKEMLYEVNMTKRGEGTSHMDVQFIGTNVQLNNWKVTPLPTKRSHGSFVFLFFILFSWIILRVVIQTF